MNIVKIYKNCIRPFFNSAIIVKIIENDYTIIFKDSDVYYLLYIEFNIRDNIKHIVHQSLSKIHCIAEQKISLFPKFKYSELGEYGYFYIFELPFKSDFNIASEKNIFNSKDFLLKKIIGINLHCNYSNIILKFIQEIDDLNIKWNDIFDLTNFKKMYPDSDINEKIYIFQKLDSCKIYEDKFDNLGFIDINSVRPIKIKSAFTHTN